MNNIFEKIPADLHSEVFDSLVEANGVRIERIVSRGHASPESGWYDQNRDEWVMLLRGKAIIAFADKPSITLREGDYVIIKAHEEHRVELTDPGVETIWLAVHYES